MLSATFCRSTALRCSNSFLSFSYPSGETSIGSEDFGTGLQVYWATLLVTVIVVSYNTKELLRRCLLSLQDQHEVIVVDNASHDGSALMVRDEFPGVKLIENSRNIGFGAANNLGIKIATGEAILLLNSDAFATDGSIQSLCNELNSSDVVACGGRLLNVNAENQLTTTQNSCCSKLTLWAVLCEQTSLEKLFPDSKLLSPYWLTSRLLAVSATQTHEVEQVMGACLIFKPRLLFDEDFFLYCEDTEFCHRLRQLGKIRYCPQASFGHQLGASSLLQRHRSIGYYNYGKELYFAKHHGNLSRFLCLLMNRFGAVFRFLVFGIGTVLSLGIHKALRQRASLWLKVLFMPLKGPS